MDWPAFFTCVFEKMLARGDHSPEYRDYLIAELARRKGTGPPFDPLTGRQIRERFSRFDPL
jgi:hypothetical protein